MWTRAKGNEYNPVYMYCIHVAEYILVGFSIEVVVTAAVPMSEYATTHVCNIFTGNRFDWRDIVVIAWIR